MASTRVESVSNSFSLTSRTIEVRRERSADERSAVCWLSALVELAARLRLPVLNCAVNALLVLTAEETEPLATSVLTASPD